MREVLYWWDSDWHTCALSLVRQLSALTQWQLSPLRSRLLTLRCEDILLYITVNVFLQNMLRLIIWDTFVSVGLQHLHY